MSEEQSPQEGSEEPAPAIASEPSADAAPPPAGEVPPPPPAGEVPPPPPPLAEPIADEPPAAEITPASSPGAGPAQEAIPDPPVDSSALLLEAEIARLTAAGAELETQTAAAQRRADELTGILSRQTAIADELHAENRRLRDGEIREAIAPLVRGIARLADELARMQEGSEIKKSDIDYVTRALTDLLHDSGVEFARPEAGEAFDPHVHQAVGSADTADRAADRTVAEVRRPGLRRDDGRMLRPAEVVVHRFKPPAAPEEPAAGEPPTNEENR